MLFIEWKFHFLMIIQFFWSGQAALHLHSRIPGQNHTVFLTKVCPLMLESSKNKCIQIVTVTSEFDTTALIHNLHTTLIPTLHVNDLQAMKPQFANVAPKTMLFLLDDLSDVLNFILGSQNFGKEMVTITPPNAPEKNPLYYRIQSASHIPYLIFVSDMVGS